VAHESSARTRGEAAPRVATRFSRAQADGGCGKSIAAGSRPAGKGLPLKARLQIPVALATMHMSWGWGFLTSPRSLARKVIASRRPAVHADAGTH
jgi:hypothetical protein